jgi:hypothetical protein
MSRMMLFIGLTLYCILGSLFLGYIGVTQGTPITDTTQTIDNPGWNSGFALLDFLASFVNGLIFLVNIIINSFIYAVELPILINLFLITIPTIFWIIIGASMLIPTTNAGS